MPLTGCARRVGEPGGEFASSGRRRAFSATIAPSIASMKPRATESPSPTPSGRDRRAAGTARRARPRAVHRFPGRGRRPRAWRSRPRVRRPPRPADRCAPWRRELSSTLTRTRWRRPRSASHRRQVLGDVDRDPLPRLRQREQGAGDHLVERHRVELDAERAGLKPARIKEVADHPVEPIGRVLDRFEELGALLVGPLDVGLAQAADRRLDPRQRRAQVVSDRRQQRRSLLVDRGQRPRLLGLAAQDLALVGGPRGRGKGLEHAPVLGEQGRAAADQAQVGSDRHVEAKRRLLPGRRPADVLDLDPLAAPRWRALSPTDSIRTSRGRAGAPRAAIPRPRARGPRSPTSSRPPRGRARRHAPVSPRARSPRSPAPRRPRRAPGSRPGRGRRR